MPLEPIDSGDMGTCPTEMANQLKKILPLIAKALDDADGPAPYATYRFEDVKKELGSSSQNLGGFVACINRLLSENMKDKTDIVAHSAGDNILFNRVKRLRRVVID
jgi:hypothetical protein